MGALLYCGGISHTAAACVYAAPDALLHCVYVCMRWQVYDAIASHFSSTRFAVWPKVRVSLGGQPVLQCCDWSRTCGPASVGRPAPCMHRVNKLSPGCSHAAVQLLVCRVRQVVRLVVFVVLLFLLSLGRPRRLQQPGNFVCACGGMWGGALLDAVCWLLLCGAPRFAPFWTAWHLVLLLLTWGVAMASTWV